MRRLDEPAHGRECSTGMTCPAVFELPDGRIAVMGTDVTDGLRESLAGAGPFPGRACIVSVPRQVLRTALRNL